MDLPALTIFCTFCRTGLAVVVRIPDVCPACDHPMGEGDWSIWWPQPIDPRFPFELTRDDRGFLHSLDIQTDEG